MFEPPTYYIQYWCSLGCLKTVRIQAWWGIGAKRQVSKFVGFRKVKFICRAK